MKKIDKRLSKEDVGRIYYLADKMDQAKNIKLFFKLAHKIGVNKLEHNIGLVLEDKKIKDRIPYLIKLCQLENKKK